MVKKHRGIILPLLLVLAVLLSLFWFFTALDNIKSDHMEEGRLQLENALRRASAACYAAEGVYPPDIQYITENYGVQVDASRYTVFYEIFADNLMPDITVILK